MEFDELIHTYPGLLDYYWTALGYKNRQTMLPLSSGWHSHTHTHTQYYKFCVDRNIQISSCFKFFFNMVRTIIFFLAGAVIAVPVRVISLPLPSSASDIEHAMCVYSMITFDSFDFVTYFHDTGLMSCFLKMIRWPRE